MKKTIVIPVLNKLSLTQALLKDLQVTECVGNLDIVIVDDGSTDYTPIFLYNYSWPRGEFRIVKHSSRRGVAASWNAGIKEAMKTNPDYIAVLNNDLALPPVWLSVLVNYAREKDCWCVSPESTKKIKPKNFQDMAVRALHNTKARRGLVGFCFVVKAEALKLREMEDGYYIDPQFEGQWYEDKDLMMWLTLKGNTPMILSRALIHHYESKTVNEIPTKSKERADNRHRLIKKWGLPNLKKYLSHQF